ncbi:AIPR family protein [Lysinibacillus odysseyi]|uniref:Abortive phage infection protein n=1 Tax=Lysinibacillus odysseyi 34hs-1 = NBRC 100172 TaxID=1220589 RepID=A0A0A3J0Y4_9BACI|nr:AIPR family protein [Lysinibacillus odysseyi]KGR88798.1 abortive phage infection protein [Lysinibacillus odysseyi 34hs-1 = NBRC 100172]
MNTKFKVKTVRTVTAPSNPNVTTYYAWTEFQDLPEGISLEVNPRKPKMNTSVAKQLISAVKSPDNGFELNNRGIVITANSFKFHTNDSMAELDLGDDPKKFGILDGGHTYQAIIDNRKYLSRDTKKYVKLEILVGEDLDVSALADARNTSAQVSDIALFELDDKFGFIKEAIKQEVYANDVAYKDNDNKRIPVIELLKLMFAFNIKRYPDDSSAPVSAYSGKASVFKDYKNSFDSNPNIYEQLALQLPKLVELYEKIETELPKKYQEFKNEEGRTGRFGSLRGVESNGTFSTLYTQQTLSHEISIGFILPIFGAFRALLKEKDGILKWNFDPIEIWEKAGLRLVQNTFDTDTNPQQVGKSKTLWQSNYRIVDSVQKDLLLAYYMEQQNK